MRMYLNGGKEFTMYRETRTTLEIKGEQFSMYVCLKLEKEMRTPIFALVTDYSKDGLVLGS